MARAPRHRDRSARLADIRLHARQIRQMHVDAREFLPGEVLRHRHRHEFLVHRDVVRHALLLRIGQQDDLADGVQRRLDTVGRLLRHQQNAIVAAVVGELDAKAIDDAPARRRDQMLADAVVLGLDLVLIAVLDLQLIEPPAEDREHRGHAAGETEAAARETRVAAFVLAVEQRHQKSLLSGPTRRR